MKSKNEKVPEFDDIIFENRNRNYGAYSLRKHYKSAASISVIGGMALFTIMVIAFSFSSQPGTATPGVKIVVIAMSDPLIPKVLPAEKKPPENPVNTIKNLKPEVTEDTTEITVFIPTAEQLVGIVQPGNPGDSIAVPENPEPVIPPEKKEPFISVEEMPSFPGGEPALFKYIGENLNYPLDAQINNIQGKVLLKFVVNPDGSADRIEILRSVDPLLDNEAMRVIKSLPRFKPGKQGGVAVPVWFVIPVSFKLENN
jgi:protein TonB